MQYSLLIINLLFWAYCKLTIITSDHLSSCLLSVSVEFVTLTTIMDKTVKKNYPCNQYLLGYMQSKPPLLWKTKLITDCKTFCLNLRLSKPTLNCIVQTRFLAIIKGIDKSKSRLTTILSNNTVSQLSKQYLLNDSYTAKWNQYCLQCVTSISQCVIWKIIFKFLTLVTSILSSLWKCPLHGRDMHTDMLKYWIPK